MNLSREDKEKLIKYMTDTENVFDDFYFGDLVDRVPDEDVDSEVEEEYYQAVKEFTDHCREKLIAELGEKKDVPKKGAKKK